MKLTLSDAKMFLRVDSSDEDEAVIIPIIATAKQLVRKKSKRKTRSSRRPPTMP